MGYSQWWMPLLFGVIANIALIPMIWLGLKYRDDNLFVIHEKLLGKWLGKSINIVLLVYFIIVIAAVCASYFQLIQVSALIDRTITGPLIIFLLLLIYIVSGEIKSIARFCIIAFFLTIGSVYFLKWGFVAGDIRHMMPFFNFNTAGVLHSNYKRVTSGRRFRINIVLFSTYHQSKKSIETCFTWNMDIRLVHLCIYLRECDVFFRLAT